MGFGALIRDVRTYLTACCEVAIGVRQRSNAVVGLVAALLALPIVWALGGKLEPTETGAYWIAVWLTTLAAVLILVVSPFFLWRSQTAKLAVLSNAQVIPQSYETFWYRDAVFFLVHGKWPAKDRAYRRSLPQRRRAILGQREQGVPAGRQQNIAKSKAIRF